MSEWRIECICLAAATVLSLVPCGSFAAHLDRDAAGRRAQAWAQRGKRFGAGFGGGKVRGTHRFETASSNDFYAVSFEKGGTVFLSGDDEGGDTPLAFTSSTNDFTTIDRASPLWALLSKRVAKDAERRTRAATAMSPRAATTGTYGTAGTYATTASSVSTVDDLRVAPLLETQWSQSTVSGGNCYNYYTPNNYVCGCVATAMAQLMRYHRYPASSTAVTHTCYINPHLSDGVKIGATNLTMLAGTYDWSNMPLKPASGVNETQRQAIGKLCYDAGVSVHMSYNSGGSGAFMCNVPAALKEIFGYASAYGYSGKEITKESAADGQGVVQKTVLANLDAGYPVLFGISGTSGGHCVVGDGYGYMFSDSETNLYVHINMGWAGSSDLWYDIPTVGGYSCFSDVIYNIFPNESSDYAILSGRVTDQTGCAVPNLSVQISGSYRKSVNSGYKPSTTTASLSTNLITSSSGGYVAILPAGTYTVSATTARGTATTSSLALSANVNESITWTCYILDDGSWTESFPADQIFVYNGELYGTVGNSWGNDLVVDTTRPDPILTYAYYQKVPYIGPYTYYNSSNVRTTTNLWPWVTSGTNPYYGAYNIRTVDDYADITDKLALSKVYYESSSTVGKYWGESTNLVLTLGCIVTNVTTGTTNYELDTTNYVYTGLYYNKGLYGYIAPELLRVEDGTGRASDPANDYDGDGFSSAEELAWGIDPANPTNFPFAFTSLSLTNLTFIGSVQGTLEVLRATNLADWSQAEVMKRFTLHPSVTNTVDLTGGNASNTFYRVRWTP